MFFERIKLLDFLSLCRQGDAGYSETRLRELLSQCRQSAPAVRVAILRCCDYSKNSCSGDLLAKCGSSDAAAWEELLAVIEKPLTEELRLLNLIAGCLEGDADAAIELCRSFESRMKGLLAY